MQLNFSQINWYKIMKIKPVSAIGKVMIKYCVNIMNSNSRPKVYTAK